jgi:hypothetical protein
VRASGFRVRAFGAPRNDSAAAIEFQNVKSDVPVDDINEPARGLGAWAIMAVALTYLAFTLDSAYHHARKRGGL